MRLNPRTILIMTMLILALLLALWIDKLYLKQMGFLGYKYELLKIVIHCGMAYAVSKYAINKFDLQEKFGSLSSNKIFLITFLIINAYIVIQYSARAISHRIINTEIRKDLSSRTVKLGPAGWGFECDSLTYNEYKELTKKSEIIRLPKEANSIFVHDWYEFDFRRTVEFEVPIALNIFEYYKNDSLILNNLSKIEYANYVSRTSFNEYGRFSNAKQVKFDTLKYRRFMYEISDN